MECLIFRGCCSKGKGFTYGKALALSKTYHHEATTWIGHRVKMHCVICTLRDVKGDLCMVRDQERDKTLEQIWQQYQQNDKNNPFAPAEGQGCTCCADSYYVQIFLRKECDWKLGGHLDEVRDHHSYSREHNHERWHIHHGKKRPQSLYDHQVTPKRAPRGHPLGGGHPKRVPQDFRDAYHSAREEQSDMLQGSGSDSEEEFDDIVTVISFVYHHSLVLWMPLKKAFLVCCPRSPCQNM